MRYARTRPAAQFTAAPRRSAIGVLAHHSPYAVAVAALPYPRQTKEYHATSAYAAQMNEIVRRHAPPHTRTERPRHTPAVHHGREKHDEEITPATVHCFHAAARQPPRHLPPLCHYAITPAARHPEHHLSASRRRCLLFAAVSAAIRAIPPSCYHAHAAAAAAGRIVARNRDNIEHITPFSSVLPGCPFTP